MDFLPAMGYYPTWAHGGQLGTDNTWPLSVIPQEAYFGAQTFNLVEQIEHRLDPGHFDAVNRERESRGAERT